jgi:antitoxin VapB
MAVPRKSTKTAKLILRGGYQYVILPRGFEFKGKAVRIRKAGDAVILEPVINNAREWFAAIDRHGFSGDFMAGGRNQPLAPKRRLFD